jgi:hypothetical protein
MHYTLMSGHAEAAVKYDNNLETEDVKDKENI